MTCTKLTFVGDLFPANLPEHIGTGIAGKFKEHRGRPWVEQLKLYFHDSDYAFANLESPLIRDSDYASQTKFAGAASFANFLKEIGIDIVSVANNHILEQGEEGFRSTIKLLNKNKIASVGLFDNGTSCIHITNINGLKIGYAAFNAKHDIHNPDLYANYSREAVLKALAKLKEVGADYKILSFHWGDEYIQIPSPNQIKDARFFVEQGANLIVGHHPHVIQGFEKYKNGYIFYSLGNFLFDMVWSEKVRKGMLLQVNIDKERNVSIKVEPVFLNNNYLPCKPHNKKKFNIEIEKLNRKIYDLADTDFYKYYIFRHKKNRLKERMKMKLYMFRNWNRISAASKHEFLNKLKARLNIKK